MRWLRPDYQDPDGTTQQQLVEIDTVTPVAAKDRASFPTELPRQVEALRQMLAKVGRPVTSEELAKSFKGARRDKVRDLLEVLVSLGQVREDGGRFLG